MQLNIKNGRLAAALQCCAVALGLIHLSPSSAMAQDAHTHLAAQEAEDTTAQTNANTLLKAVRAATERFQDVKVAEAQGYALQFGCVTGDDAGAMGLHYVNANLVSSGVLDPTQPQIIIY